MTVPGTVCSVKAQSSFFLVQIASFLTHWHRPARAHQPYACQWHYLRLRIVARYCDKQRQQRTDLWGSTVTMIEFVLWQPYQQAKLFVVMVRVHGSLLQRLWFEVRDPSSHGVYVWGIPVCGPASRRGSQCDSAVTMMKYNTACGVLLLKHCSRYTNRQHSRHQNSVLRSGRWHVKLRPTFRPRPRVPQHNIPRASHSLAWVFDFNSYT